MIGRTNVILAGFRHVLLAMALRKPASTRILEQHIWTRSSTTGLQDLTVQDVIPFLTNPGGNFHIGRYANDIA
jgi:hypothetical protein